MRRNIETLINEMKSKMSGYAVMLQYRYMNLCVKAEPAALLSFTVTDDEEEETFMYDIRKPMAFINEGDNGVFDINRQTGINTAKSVFEKGTLFVTGRR